MSEAERINFFQLNSAQLTNAYEGHFVEIRGFLHHFDDGQWILTDEASLKSCCVASEMKLGKQIYLLGPLSITNSTGALDIQGTIRLRPFKNSEGIVLQKYFLENPVLLKNPQQISWGLYGFALLSIVVILYACTKRTKDEGPKRQRT